jgi:transcriptional regulator with XRE-family HTH domain
MDKKVKSSLLRKYRNEKHWSQEQLAAVSGLSLRTIQRLESRGSGSQESLKALAAVFSVPPDKLVWFDGKYQAYLHKQWGTGIPGRLGLPSHRADGYK